MFESSADRSTPPTYCFSNDLSSQHHRCNWLAKTPKHERRLRGNSHALQLLTLKDQEVLFDWHHPVTSISSLVTSPGAPKTLFFSAIKLNTDRAGSACVAPSVGTHPGRRHKHPCSMQADINDYANPAVRRAMRLARNVRIVQDNAGDADDAIAHAGPVAAGDPELQDLIRSMFTKNAKLQLKLEKCQMSIRSRNARIKRARPDVEHRMWSFFTRISALMAKFYTRSRAYHQHLPQPPPIYFTYNGTPYTTSGSQRLADYDRGIYSRKTQRTEGQVACDIFMTEELKPIYAAVENARRQALTVPNFTDDTVDAAAKLAAENSAGAWQLPVIVPETTLAFLIRLNEHICNNFNQYNGNNLPVHVANTSAYLRLRSYEQYINLLIYLQQVPYRSALVPFDLFDFDYRTVAPRVLAATDQQKLDYYEGTACKNYMPQAECAKYDHDKFCEEETKLIAFFGTPAAKAVGNDRKVVVVRDFQPPTGAYVNMQNGSIIANAQCRAVDVRTLDAARDLGYNRKDEQNARNVPGGQINWIQPNPVETYYRRRNDYSQIEYGQEYTNARNVLAAAANAAAANAAAAPANAAAAPANAGAAPANAAAAPAAPAAAGAAAAPAAPAAANDGANGIGGGTERSTKATAASMHGRSMHMRSQPVANAWIGRKSSSSVQTPAAGRRQGGGGDGRRSSRPRRTLSRKGGGSWQGGGSTPRATKGGLAATEASPRRSGRPTAKSSPRRSGRAQPKTALNRQEPRRHRALTPPGR